MVNHQSLYWIRYQNQFTFSPSWYWNNEFDNRRFFSPGMQNQFIIHSHLHYKFNRWDVGAGITSSWAYAQKPEVGYEHAIHELRGVTEVSHITKLGKINFQNRLRFDYRFFQESEAHSVFEESIYVFRIRYRAQFTFPIKKLTDDGRGINLRLADEIMLNHEGNTFDQNRIYATMDFLISKKITLETGYIYSYQQRVGQKEFFERHIARFTMLHKISRARKNHTER